MADRFDEIMKAAADRADADVNYAAMHASTLKKAQAKKLALRRNVLRYGSVAAAAVLLIGAGIAAFGGGLAGMRAKSGDQAYFAAEQPAALESTKDSLGDAITNGVAPADGAGGAAATSAPETISPPVCGLSGCALYWAEQELELPAVTFGESANVESDETHFLYTVTGCASEDFDAYVALVKDMYPGSAPADEERTACDVSSVSLELMDGQYLFTVSLADGVLTISVQTIEA
ncbi:MAG TPA: hypothetical protein VN540_09515 [Clostridia bacterium]|nr:hypothetical protein [Clostridia bacterium]